ncbi:MAG: hypothetical protein RI988_3430 [Pseudomonadota bacterium]|jgi:hypothetical protein
MQWDAILQIFAALVMALGGWFLRELWGAVKELRTDLAGLRADLPKEYVSKDDFRQDIGRIHELLDKIYDKLDTKAPR